MGLPLDSNLDILPGFRHIGTTLLLLKLHEIFARLFVLTKEMENLEAIPKKLSVLKYCCLLRWCFESSTDDFHKNWWGAIHYMQSQNQRNICDDCTFLARFLLNLSKTQTSFRPSFYVEDAARRWFCPNLTRAFFVRSRKCKFGQFWHNSWNKVCKFMQKLKMFVCFVSAFLFRSKKRI